MGKKKTGKLIILRFADFSGDTRGACMKIAENVYLIGIDKKLKQSDFLDEFTKQKEIIKSKGESANIAAILSGAIEELLFFKKYEGTISCFLWEKRKYSGPPDPLLWVDEILKNKCKKTDV